MAITTRRKKVSPKAKKAKVNRKLVRSPVVVQTTPHPRKRGKLGVMQARLLRALQEYDGSSVVWFFNNRKGVSILNVTYPPQEVSVDDFKLLLRTNLLFRRAPAYDLTYQRDSQGRPVVGSVLYGVSQLGERVLLGLDPMPDYAVDSMRKQRESSTDFRAFLRKRLGRK